MELYVFSLHTLYGLGTDDVFFPVKYGSSRLLSKCGSGVIVSPARGCTMGNVTDGVNEAHAHFTHDLKQFWILTARVEG